MKIETVKDNQEHELISDSARPVHEVKNGELLICRSALQEIDALDDIQQRVLKTIREVAGSEKSDAVKHRGFEQLHDILSGPEIKSVNHQVKQAFRGFIPGIVKRFVQELLEYEERFYIGTNPMIRFFVPHDHYTEHRELFSEDQGSLKIQGPHHDAWFRNPEECLNVWMAVGRVQRGNGMMIYQDRWGDFIQHDGNREIPRDQSLGNNPVNFSLNPGDVLVFHGAHLHTSELNRTDETRFVITSRFTTNTPTFSEDYTWRSFHDSTLINTPLSGLSTARSYLSISFLTRLADKVQESLWKFLPVDVNNNRSDAEMTGASLDSPYEEPLQEGVEQVENGLQIDAAEIREGEITPVSKRVCVLKENGSLYAFSRFCPHEGADLSKGFVNDQDQSIHCSWHNLCLDPQTGSHDCSSLSELKTYPVSKLDETTFNVQLSS